MCQWQWDTIMNVFIFSPFSPLTSPLRSCLTVISFLSAILFFLCPYSALFLPFYDFPASSSLYQPPRPRPSAVWSPCAATNMGRAAVPAWPASWSKWPDGARQAQAAATHPAAATGGEDEDRMNRSLWILMNPQHVTVLKIWAAVLRFSP